MLSGVTAAFERVHRFGVDTPVFAERLDAVAQPGAELGVVSYDQESHCRCHEVFSASGPWR